MNRPVLFATLIAPLVLPLSADSGGPYLAVPDATETEKGPVFQIPQEAKPLRHFLTHMPDLIWNKELHEPNGFTWQPISGYHASLSSLDHAGGHALLCVRYVSDKHIDQGIDHAEGILVLARNQGTGPDSMLCVPVLYATGRPDVHYDWNASSLKTERFGGFKITGHISGNGGFRKEIFVRSQDWKFVRFQPKAPDLQPRSQSPAKATDAEEATE